MYLELNCFALAILLLIYLNIRHYINKYLLDQKIFLVLIYLNAFILIVDAIMWLFDGRSGGAFTHGFYVATTVGYYTFNPLICLMWYLYADFSIYRKAERLRKRLVPMLIPILAIFILALVSVQNGMLFSINADNVYRRGPYFLIMAGVCFGYLLYTTLITVFNHKKMRSMDFRTLLFFPIPPIVGGVVQTLFYGVSLIWVCTTLSLLIIFIKYQNSQLNTDHLTGLFNRRQLDNFLHAKDQAAGGKVVAGLMIDLNYFKAINDTYGHSEGDRALTQVAGILKRTFRESDFVARYGGDEFVVIMEVNGQTDLEKAIERLHANVAQFNAKKIMPFEISLSIGSGTYEPNGKNTSEFMNRIDRLMYEEKDRCRCMDDGVPKQ
jgi:diguanylate cyclase (GGDEF)-like protein